MPHKEKQDWKIEFEKKHYGAMFECGDYDKLIEDIESTHTTLLQSVVKDLLEMKEWSTIAGEKYVKVEDIISYFKNKHGLDI